ncbi:histidine ammonia-lyase [Paraburkholderia sp. WSM4179]|nr:histidine ammonia-lyase [Paraburkholderia sp. WSM4179]
MICLLPGHLTLPQLRRVTRESGSLRLDPASHAAIDACAQAVADIAAKGEPAYGINTGFGRLASTHIPHDQLELLQRNLVLSHAVGVGEPMSRPVVRLLIALKLSSLGRGHSGVRREVMEALITLYNADVLPVIPVKGSVGASGDLASLAHMSAVLLGVGEVFAKGERVPATEGLALVGLKPLTLQAKEGLALLNGTQASTALALYNMFAIEDLYRTALVRGALSVDAAMGSVKPFDARIHELRGHQGQIEAAAAYRLLLQGSGINVSHADCDKVQDPVQPALPAASDGRVSGSDAPRGRRAAAGSQRGFRQSADFPGHRRSAVGRQLPRRAGRVRRRQPRACRRRNRRAGRTPHRVADRRHAVGPAAVPRTRRRCEFWLHDRSRDRCRLASENKTLAHPASVDSLPTSANQEDHVSMATFAARKLGDIAENTANILSIELLAAAQGVDLRAPHKTSPSLQKVMDAVRKDVAHYELEHYFGPDIAAVTHLVQSGTIATHSPYRFYSEG